MRITAVVIGDANTVNTVRMETQNTIDAALRYLMNGKKLYIHQWTHFPNRIAVGMADGDLATFVFDEAVYVAQFVDKLPGMAEGLSMFEYTLGRENYACQKSTDTRHKKIKSS